MFGMASAFNVDFEYPANNDEILGSKCPSKFDFRNFLDHFLKEFHTCFLVLLSNSLGCFPPLVVPALLVVHVHHSSLK